MEGMDQTCTPGTCCLEGTYTESDLRAFATFLASRVAGSKLWALGVFMLMPLFWSGDIRSTWPITVPIAVVLAGFILLLRFVLLPSKLYKAAIKLPGVFEPRRIVIDSETLQNRSEAGGHVLRLEDVKEVVTTPDHLFVMVGSKQGIPIPRTWIGDSGQVAQVTASLLARKIPSPR